jgi:hypothetical protein
MPYLPIAARQAHIFPQLKHNALISISQFCDHGCTALFTSTDVQILVNSTTIIRGSWQPTTGLWTIDLDNQPNLPNSSKRILGHASNSVYEMETKANLVAYLHRCSYSPTTYGWLKAIKNGFSPLGLALTRIMSKNIFPSQPPPSKAINVSNSKTYDPRHLRGK